MNIDTIQHALNLLISLPDGCFSGPAADIAAFKEEITTLWKRPNPASLKQLLRLLHRLLSLVPR